MTDEKPSEVTQHLVAELVARDGHGRRKYGTTLDRTDLSPDEWLQHLKEELLDAAGYVEALKRARHRAGETVCCTRFPPLSGERLQRLAAAWGCTPERALAHYETMREVLVEAHAEAAVPLTPPPDDDPWGEFEAQLRRELHQVHFTLTGIDLLKLMVRVVGAVNTRHVRAEGHSR